MKASQRLQITPKTSEQDKLYLIHQIALEAATDSFEGILDGATIYYHTKAVSPAWSAKMHLVDVVGFHKFFKERKND